MLTSASHWRTEPKIQYTSYTSETAASPAADLRMKCEGVEYVETTQGLHRLDFSRGVSLIPLPNSSVLAYMESCIAWCKIIAKGYKLPGYSSADCPLLIPSDELHSS